MDHSSGIEKNAYNGSPDHSGAHSPDAHAKGRAFSITSPEQNELHRSLKGRHMQMIAIGGAIGSGLFIGSGGSFVSGGPASVIIGFLAIGFSIYLMMQALAELAVMYPINGAFTMYICRFIDPSFGFACAWEYAISWLTVLPFEISAACNIIHYWQGSQHINNAAWITPMLVALIAIQYFGVRGYGEVEFVLSMVKITACLGFMILGIVINVGGVPTDNRGYIGNRYFKQPFSELGFINGFHGFCSVFVNAAFAYTGTELTGLAAAEAANPRKEIPRASKQVVWRILIFYVVNLTLVGLDVPSTEKVLTGDGPESRFSPFVIAIRMAGIEALPSIFNAVILMAVLSVANSCMFGSTRTIQALAANNMAPKILAYVDRKGRPLSVIILQMLFGLLAYINLADDGGTIFDWLLALSGITVLFVFGAIALAHIRFRMAWKHNGHTLDELPFRAVFGVWGSWICVGINGLALIASFYTALYPLGGTYLTAKGFFLSYLAGPLLVFLYLCWKVYSWFVHPEHRPLYVKIKDIDIYTGMREEQRQFVDGMGENAAERRHSVNDFDQNQKQGVVGWMKAGLRSLV